MCGEATIGNTTFCHAFRASPCNALQLTWKNILLAAHTALLRALKRTKRQIPRLGPCRGLLLSPTRWYGNETGDGKRAHDVILNDIIWHIDGSDYTRLWIRFKVNPHVTGMIRFIVFKAIIGHYYGSPFALSDMWWHVYSHQGDKVHSLNIMECRATSHSHPQQVCSGIWMHWGSQWITHSSHALIYVLLPSLPPCPRW